MISLYHAPGTSSTAVKLALQLADVKFEVKQINVQEGQHFSPEFKQLNPLSKVPVLVEENGQVLTEGSAILLYLAEKHPHAELMPATDATERADALKWLFFVENKLHSVFGRLFVPQRYADNVEDVRVKAVSELNDTIGVVAEHLEKNDYLAGHFPTLADYYLTVVLQWQFILPESLESKHPVLTRYLERMRKIPAVANVLSQEFGG